MMNYEGDHTINHLLEFLIHSDDICRSLQDQLFNSCYYYNNILINADGYLYIFLIGNKGNMYYCILSVSRKRELTQNLNRTVGNTVKIYLK